MSPWDLRIAVVGLLMLTMGCCVMYTTMPNTAKGDTDNVAFR